MKKEKLPYEAPTVKKVEFDFKTRIAASGCTLEYSTEWWTCEWDGTY